VFVYDCSRFLFLLALTASLAPGAALSGGVELPQVMIAAPNALFPLMSFFVLFRFDISRSYAPLYMAGKTCALICLGAWIVFSPPRQAGLNPGRSVAGVSWAVFLGAADVGTIMGMAVIKKRTTPPAASIDMPPGASDSASGGIPAAEGG
jgi:hypothetical protein